MFNKNSRLCKPLLGLFVAAGYWLFLRVAIDPRPLTTPNEVQSLAAVSLPAGERLTEWLGMGLPEGGMVRLTAAHAGGEEDVLYGALWGTADDYLAIGLSPLGYVVLEQVTAEGTTPLLPLQTFPHGRGGTAENSLWLQPDPATHQLTIRLNGEILWHTAEAPPAWLAEAELGRWGESFGGTAEINFVAVELWGE